MQTLPGPRAPVPPSDVAEPSLRWWVRPGRPPRLVVTGEIDMATVTQFERAVSLAVQRHGRLIMDLTGVEFIGSGGIHVLYDQLEHLVAVLVTPDDIAARALSIVRFPCLVVVPPGRGGDLASRIAAAGPEVTPVRRAHRSAAAR